MANSGWTAAKYFGYFLLFCVIALALWVAINIIMLWALIDSINKGTRRAAHRSPPAITQPPPITQPPAITQPPPPIP